MWAQIGTTKISYYATIDISKLKIIVKVDGDFIPVANFKYKKTNEVNVCFACSFSDPSIFRKSKEWLDIEKDDSTYKRDFGKRIELINWVLENMKSPDVQICEIIELRKNEIILKINQTYSIIEADKLYSELKILDWIFFQVCINEK